MKNREKKQKAFTTSTMTAAGNYMEEMGQELGLTEQPKAGKKQKKMK